MKEAIVESAAQFSQWIKDKKTVCIYTDDDADGICAAALCAKFLKRKGIDSKHISFQDTKPFSERHLKLLDKCDGAIFIDVPIAVFGFYEKYAKFKDVKPICIFDHHVDDAVYDQPYFNTARLQSKVAPLQYCCSKLLFDITIVIDPGMKQYAWLACIGLIGDFNHRTWKKIIQFAIEEENKLHNTNISIPQTIEDIEATNFAKATDLVNFASAKKEATKAADLLTTTDTLTQAFEKLQQYKIIGEDVTDYIENFNYFMQNAPHKKTLQVFELEIKSQYDIRRIVADKIAFIAPDTFIYAYNREHNIVHISARLENNSLDLSTIFKNIRETTNIPSLGGQGVVGGGVVPSDQFKNVTDALYAELGKHG